MRNPKENNRKKRRFSGILIVIILLAVVLMSAFLVFRCLTFDENGAHVIDRYGILAAEGSNTGLVDYSQYANGSGASTVVDDTDSGKQEKKTTQKKEKTISSTVVAVCAVTVPAKDLTYDDDFRNQLISLKQQGLLDTIIVDLKNSDGWLCNAVTSSSSEIVTDSIAADYADDFPSAVAQVKDAGIRVIGRIYCFRDDLMTQQNSDLSCWYEDAGTNWLDSENHRWLDPTNDLVVQYLCDIAKAGVSSGCDELVLDEFCFPAGQTDLISFANPQEFSTALGNDLTKIKEAAGSAPVSLWLDTDLTSASEQGQDMSVLYDLFERVFTSDANQLVSMTDGGAKATTVYTDRDLWSNATGSAVYDTVGDMYQIFYIK